MLQKLQVRLTTLLTVLTALVLGGAIGFAGSMAYRQYKENYETLLLSSFSAIRSQFENGNSISDTWLEKQEANHSFILYIEDNEIPFDFSNRSEADPDRDFLISQGKNAFFNALEDGDIQQNTQYRFSLSNEDGEPYNCVAILLASDDLRANGTLIMSFQKGSALQKRLNQLVVQYFLLWCAGTAALGCISYMLVRLSLKPTKLALQQQNEFIAAASHELRSPLTVIKSSIQEAQNPTVILAEKEKFLQIASSEVERMRRLTDDLLQLAGQDANVWHSEMRPLELDTFCIELYEEYRVISQQKGHTLSLHLPDVRFPAISGDKQRLEQLFSILLNNALEYAPQGTPVEISAIIKGRTIQVSIIDHGIGIPDSAKQAVFDRFFRGDKSRTDKAHFGLGLSVAKEIANIHDAHIFVCDTPGGGATFTVSFLCLKK